MRNALWIVIAAAALWAQPAWKEFSIGAPVVGRNQNGPFGIRASGMPLLRAISKSYGTPEHRILGPAWLATEKYAIVAEVAEPKDFQPLFQRELADRFHMLAHREQRNVPVFVLKTLDSPATLSAAHGAAPQPGSSSLQGGPRPLLEMFGSNLDAFVAALADSIRRPVFNETGVDGTFHIQLSWQFGNLASLQEAVKKQLGLQLVDDNRTVELLVVDHIEKLQVK